MKKILFMIMTVLGWINLTSCNDYLDIVPKGNKIPTTLADFEALLRDEYTIGYIPVTNSLYLLNDKFVGQSSLTSVTLTSANYLWNETADRIVLNNQDEGTITVVIWLFPLVISCWSMFPLQPKRLIPNAMR